MRRKDRQMADGDAVALLEKGQYGVLSTVSADGEPYGVPLNYCFRNGCVYFHCAACGQKIDNITAHPRVAFCVVGQVEVLAGQFATNYESCMVRGLAEEVSGEEKQAALEGLIHKYSANFVAEGLKYIDKLREKTRVFKISVESISGKARR